MVKKDPGMADEDLSLRANTPDDDEEDLAPGMTAGDLRRALEGVADDIKVTIRTEDFAGGIVALGLEEGCDGVKHFAIDASSDWGDFEDSE